MQNMKHIQKKNKGFAMGYVLIIIAMFTFLGAAMLMVSSSNMRTVTLPVRYVQYFYAAESGVQLVAQHLQSEHGEAIDDIVLGITDITTDDPAMRDAIAQQIEDSIHYYILTNLFPDDTIAIPGMAPAFIPPTTIGGQTIYPIQMPNMPMAAVMPPDSGSMRWTVQPCRLTPFSLMPGADPTESMANFILTIYVMGIGHIILPQETTSGGVVVSGDIRLGVGPLNAPDTVDWQLTNVRER